MMKLYDREELKSHPLTLAHTFHLLSKDCDAYGNLRPDAALILMQEMAGGHAEMLGCGRAELLKKDIVWIIARTHTVFETVPKMRQDLTVVTWPGAAAHGLYPRHFVFYADGMQVGVASSLWMLVDVNTHAAARNTAELAPVPDAGIPAPMAAPRRIRESGELLSALKRTCAYSDLDCNGHMNNTRYAQWVCDALDPDHTPADYTRGLFYRGVE